MCRVLVLITWFIGAVAFVVLATAGIVSASDAAIVGAFVALVCNGLAGIALALVASGNEEL